VHVGQIVVALDVRQFGNVEDLGLHLHHGSGRTTLIGAVDHDQGPEGLLHQSLDHVDAADTEVPNHDIVGEFTGGEELGHSRAHAIVGA
jgi:hypothetical protein